MSDSSLTHPWLMSLTSTLYKSISYPTYVWLMPIR